MTGEGRLSYEGNIYDLQAGDCVFINCRKGYSHETGRKTADAGSICDPSDSSLWSLQWCHFYGPNMSAIYRKYQERGGKPVFRTEQITRYRQVLSDLYEIADSADYVRDMRIHEKLSSLLILLMEDAWDTEKAASGKADTADIQQVKEYLDTNFSQKITLDDLASRFFINKYYLLNLFKDHYGVTINAYLNQVRITYIKQQLRFSDKTIDMLAAELDIEPAYLSRLFKKIEGVSPTQFRRNWKGKG